MPQVEQTIVDLLVEQSLTMAKTLVQCAEPVKAYFFLTENAPACVIESKEARRFVASLEKQIDQYFSDKKYVERYAGYTNEQTNPIEPFTDLGLLSLYRAKKTQEIVAEFCQRKDKVYALGIGSGDCTLEKALLEKHPNLHIDISELLKVGSKAALKLQEMFPNRVGIQGRFDVEKQFEPKKYDLIMCLEVIEHVTSPLTLLDNMKTCLQDGGMVIVSTPNHIGWIERKLIDQFGDDNWYHHVRAYTPKTLALDAIESGLIPTILSEPNGTLFMIAEQRDISEISDIETGCDTIEQFQGLLQQLPPGSTIYANFKVSDNKTMPATIAVLNGITLKEPKEKP